MNYNNNNNSNFYQQHQDGNNNNVHNNNQTQQMATQYPNQVPITFLSILKEGKIQLGEVSNSWGENGDWLLRSLVMAVNQLLSVNDQFSNNYSQFLPEHMKLPMITIEGYIARIIKYSPCSKECYIIILMYIDRLIQKRNFIVNSYNIHRILITCVLVAAKYLDDIFYNNQFYSQVGGVGVKEINIMELDFLKLLSFDVSSNTELYSVYLNYFEKYTKRLQLSLNFQPNTKQLPLPIPATILEKSNNINNTTTTTTTPSSNNSKINNNLTTSSITPSSSFSNFNNSKSNSNNKTDKIKEEDKDKEEDEDKSVNNSKNNKNNSSTYHQLPFRYPLLA